MNLNEVKAERHDHFLAAEKLINAARAAKTDLTGETLTQYNGHIAKMKELDAFIARCNEHAGMAPKEVSPVAVYPGAAVAGSRPNGQTPVDMNRFNAELGDFMRGGRGQIMAADVPLYVGTGANIESVGATIPTEVLGHLAAYSNLDSFRLAGARILETPDTNPLVVPVISAGAAASIYAEGASATESKPFELDSFTLGGTKYARLVKVSEEALMNSALPLQTVILDELAAGIATTFTGAITTAMAAALNASVLVSKGTNDTYTTLLSLMHSIPPRFASPSNKWMLSRDTLATIKDQRASSSGVPFFDPATNRIFDRDVVLNDGLTLKQVVYGDWGNGCVIRKSPFFLLPLREAFSSEGKVGFKATQWVDMKFMCALSGVTVQPLHYTVLS